LERRVLRIESLKRLQQAYEPTNTVSNNVEDTAAGHPPVNDEEHDSPNSPGTRRSLDIIDFTRSDTEDEPKPSTHLERERMMMEMNMRKARVHATVVEAASRQPKSGHNGWKFYEYSKSDGSVIIRNKGGI
jgi:hypothetical protein